MVDTKGHRPPSLLGWSPEHLGVVLRESTNLIAGQSDRVLQSTLPRGVNADSWLGRTIKAVESFSCSRCLVYLIYIFNVGDIFILIGDLPTTPGKLLRELPSVNRALGTTIGPIQFTGGPPNKRGEVVGSFVTLLQDCILFAYYTRNQKQLAKLKASNLIRNYG